MNKSANFRFISRSIQSNYKPI